MDRATMSLTPEEFERVLFQMEMPPFDSYLETISEFLKGETRKHQQEIDDLKEQIEQGKVSPDNGSDEVPWEYQYEQHVDHLIGEIAEFENILLKSFFVTVYGFLESQLMHRCRKLRKENNYINLSISDIRGEDTLDRAMKYLIRVQSIDFSLDKYSNEWQKIQNYGILRNCVVHNEGRLDEGFEEKSRNKLIRFITQKEPNLTTSGADVVFTKEFCKKAWKTIEEFLWLVSQAENQAKA